jgi:hypothetical protein
MAAVAWLVSAGATRSPSAQTAAAAPAEEFGGPFPSWTNVKTAYGAIGDGAADDTAAFERALTAIDEAARPVLYVPAGRYRITRTLQLVSRQNVSVYGADPAQVAIVWDGPQGGTMLRVNGVAYSSISRLTFDGRRSASIAVDQSKDTTGRFFDTGNEYADDEFVDVEFGIHGGFHDLGFAETSILRNRFIRNTKAGVALGNFNALDAWIWDSLFDHCGAGVSNEPGAGNFRVYRSVFRGSTVADLLMQNTGLFTARDNYSVGSKAFFVSLRPVNHPAAVDIQRNTILDTVDAAAIHLMNQGPGLILDNTIRSRGANSGPAILWESPLGASVASIGNTFTVASATSLKGPSVVIGDRVVAAADVDPPAPAIAPHPPVVTRSIVEVASNGDGAAIQRAINQAAAQIGQRPMVHIAFGHHAVSKTIEVPAGDVQIVGDGYGTTLGWAGSGSGPVLHLAGPSRATVRELGVSGSADADGIVIDGVDQPDARVHLESVEMRAGVRDNLWVNGLAHATVEAVDIGHAYSPHATSIRIAGESAADGRPAARSKTIIFSGASAGNGLSYDVSNADAVIRDVWFEADTELGLARIRDGSHVTLQGMRMATPADTRPPAIAIANAGGRTSLLTLHMDDRIALTGPDAGLVLGVGLLREFHDSPFILGADATSSRAVFALVRQRAKTQGTFSVGTVALADRGTLDARFLDDMLAGTRATVSPSAPGSAPAGASDVLLHRVWADRARENIVIRR